VRLWAPQARRVRLDSGAGLTPAEGGWWERPDLPPGTDYGFVLDDDESVLPDPRSRRQPDGIHGLSRTVSLDTPQDFTPKPLEHSTIYELHVGTFTDEGTFDGAIERLAYLKDLGVDVVEVMPVNAFPGRHGWGYDGVDLYAVHEPYGGPEGFRRFVDAAHAHGLAVVLDVVYNHLGPSGNYLGRFGPYFTEKYRTPWGPAVNYDDAGSDEVRAFVVDNALMWLDGYGCDGLRLDAVHAIHDQSATHLLQEIATAAAPRWVIAESDLNDPRVVMPRDRGGWGCTAQWSDDLHHALHAALTGERSGYYGDFGAAGQVAKALRGAFVYDGQHSAYRQRRHGRPVPEGVEATRFLGYAQTHDQVGNRAAGERLSQLLPKNLLKVAAALVLTGPFVPMLFMGEEWGATTPWQYFTDHEDAALAEAVRKGRREEFRAFGWDDVPDPQDPETFRRSVLRWEEAQGDLLDWHRALLALRRDHPPSGAFAEASVEGPVLTMRRDGLTVVADLSGGRVDARGDVLLADESVAIR
jgi:maltooligosyltrehalose trehalohydrolase